MPETAAAYRAESPTQAAEEKKESKYPKLDGVLMPLVAANANVLVKASWIGDEPVTLSAAVNKYPRKMSEETADQIIADVYELLANRVTEDTKLGEDTKPPSEMEPDALPGKSKEIDKSSPAAGTTKKPEIKPDKELSAVAVKTKKPTPDTKPQSHEPAAKKLLDIKADAKLKKAAVEQKSRKEEPSAEAEASDIAEEDPASPEIRIQAAIMGQDLLEEIPEDEAPTAIESHEGEEELGSELSFEAVSIEDERSELYAREQEPAVAEVGIKHEEVLRPEIEATDEPAAEVEVAEEPVIEMEPTPQEPLETSLTIQDVEEAIASVTEAVQDEETARGPELFEAIEATIVLSQPETLAVEDKAEGKEALEESVTGMLEAADIPHTPELIDSLVYLTVHHQLAERLKIAITEDNPDVIEEGIGTHEIIRSLLTGTDFASPQAVNFYSIGSPALLLSVSLLNT